MTNFARKTWDEYFFDVARTVASRSTCPRLSVGVVAVREKRIVGTGYNGSLPNFTHCTESGCLFADGAQTRTDRHCLRTVHGESNLVASGVLQRGDVVYVTHRPCFTCYKLLRATGISEQNIKWETEYGKAYPLL